MTLERIPLLRIFSLKLRDLKVKIYLASTATRVDPKPGTLKSPFT